MAVRLNHTIVHARDQKAAAAFYIEVFGFAGPIPFGPFVGVQTGNEVTLDFFQTEDDFDKLHLAFLVDDAEFDQIFGRVKEKGLTYWADPAKTQAGRINTHFGGRGVYFEDPDGHFLEIITRPYSTAA